MKNLVILLIIFCLSSCGNSSDDCPDYERVANNLALSHSKLHSTDPLQFKSLSDTETVPFDHYALKASASVEFRKVNQKKKKTFALFTNTTKASCDDETAFPFLGTRIESIEIISNRDFIEVGDQGRSLTAYFNIVAYDVYIRGEYPINEATFTTAQEALDEFYLFLKTAPLLHKQHEFQVIYTLADGNTFAESASSVTFE